LKIAVIGGTGFIGRNLVRELTESGYRIRVLTRRGQSELDKTEHIESVPADIHNIDSLVSALKEIDIVYHLVGIITETRYLTFAKTVVQGTANLVEACRRNNVKKIIYLSALGTKKDAKTKYFKSKWAAENIIRNSGMEYVILRPSAVFGPEDKFINMLAGMIRKSPIIPIVGNGRYKLQPVFVNDLAKIMKDSASDNVFSGRAVDIGGPEQFSFRAIIAILKKILKKRSVNVYIPIPLVRFGAFIMEKLLKPAPVTLDQIEMLVSGNICDNSELYSLLNIRLTGLEEGITKYLR